MPAKQVNDEPVATMEALVTEPINGSIPTSNGSPVAAPVNSDTAKPQANGRESDLTAASLLGAVSRQPPVQRVEKALNLLTDTTNLPPITDPDDAAARYLPRGVASDYRARHYIASRWKPQVDYYDSKGSSNKQRHLRIQAFIGVGSALVAVVLAVLPALDLSSLSWLAAILSGFISAATVFENVYTYGDNWRKFRQASEGLKREKVMFDMGAGPYRTTKDPVLLFTERCEDIIAQETGRFFQREEQQQQQTAQAQAESSDGSGTPSPKGNPASAG